MSDKKNRTPPTAEFLAELRERLWYLNPSDWTEAMYIIRDLHAEAGIALPEGYERGPEYIGESEELTPCPGVN